MTQTSATQPHGQASDKTAIRPFRVDFPRSELTDLRRRINATRWPEQKLVTDAITRRTAGDDTEARELLADQLRLAQS
jgi:hypothetical protein